MLRARAADQPYRQAKTIGGRVDLRRQTAAGPTQALGIRPPFDLARARSLTVARTIVASRISQSRSASWARASSISSKTPRAIQS